MTGSGKSYTVGRIIERLVGQMNGTVVVFDPHGEYGRALQGGQMRFNERPDELDDQRDRAALPAIRDAFSRLREAGAGISIYSPQNPSFRQKYAGANQELALQFDHDLRGCEVEVRELASNHEEYYELYVCATDDFAGDCLAPLVEDAWGPVTVWVPEQ